MTASVTAPGPNSNEPRVMLTVEAAAQQLSISRTRMYGLIRNDEIDSVLLGRARRIPADALHEFTARLRAAQQITRRPIEN